LARPKFARLDIFVQSEDLRATSCGIGYDGRHLSLETEPRTALLARADTAVSNDGFTM
jgi:hypothetical protein